MCGAAAAGPANAGPIPHKKSVPEQARFFLCGISSFCPQAK